MTELNEALGIGDKFVIDGVEYNAHIATLEELEKVSEKIDGLYLTDKGVYLNFIKLQGEVDDKARKERIKKLFELLKIIFPGVPVDKLKKMSRKEVARAADYFLIG